MAKRCEAEGGDKADFVSYILEMWSQIGYSPDITDNSSLAEISDHEAADEFTPTKCSTSTEKFSGVSIRNLPNDADHGEVVELLVKLGLPENRKDNIKISDKGTAIIRDIENDACIKLIDAIHMKVYFSRKLFCNGVIALSPEKQNITEKSDLSQTSEPKIQTTITTESSKSPTFVIPPTDEITGQCNSSRSLELTSDWPNVPTLVRRHSLSLLNRPPHAGSLAEELLNTKLVKSSIQTEKLRTSIQDLSDALSNYNSCQSNKDTSSDEGSNKPLGARRKRGRKKSPQNSMLTKKVNLNASPK